MPKPRKPPPDPLYEPLKAEKPQPSRSWHEQPADDALSRLKTWYLDCLRDSAGNMLFAMETSNTTYEDLVMWRRMDAGFAEAEQGFYHARFDGEAFIKQVFLTSYEKNFLNVPKTLRECRLTKKQVEVWRIVDPDFVRAVSEIDELIHANAVEQVVRASVGEAKSRVDTQMLRWFLEVTDERFRKASDKADQGKIVQDLDEEILELSER
ncbi:MAG: hypothetical protein K2Q20_05685 [Phycisphaerales bacterium]|nr:hypothetical protein [Phycisphaerales bacterium]